jgi:uncharacterized protein involved in response to NO
MTDPAPHRRGALARFVPATLFFPAAALHAALVLPWSVLAMSGAVRGPVALSSPFGHAHEMLLGYALAVVAGYQVPRMSPVRLWLLFAGWVLARVAFIALPHTLLAALVNAGFAIAVALHVAPRLLRAAKKLRNQALPALLVAVCAAAAAYAVAAPAAEALTLHALVTALVLLLAGLMLFMGGRILAPAVAGEFYRQRRSLAARVQPRVEGALIAIIAVAALAAALRIDALTRTACALAGVLAAVRLARWRLWRCVHRVDLMRLAAGYAWLAVGLIAVAAAADTWRTAALHAITVGALGTLTFNVMANVTAARSRGLALREPVLAAGTVLIGAATLCRLAVPLAEHATGWLAAAAACWSIAFIALFALLLRRRGGALHEAP